MKKIFIATDFSPASHTAAVYGMQLARAMQAAVILFSAYEVSHPTGALNVQASRLAAMEETKKRLADEADRLVAGNGGQLEIVCEEGVPAAAILAVAKEKSADLLVVGMTGGGNRLKKLFGSTATSLVNHLKMPLIVVPAGANFTSPKNVLYVSDVFLDTIISGIDQMKWLTDFFGTKLFVVRVVKNSYEEVLESVNTPQNLRKELKAMKASFSFPVNENIADGLEEFISEQTVDLMVMVPHKHEWLERLFVKSKTEDTAFHTHTPILMLPDTAGDAVNTAPVQMIANYN
ncbi:universal stress protein [Flavisolibacter ginsenosidimutans]|nr:universal stress protein [Flavisolibacter ginsenosidimutans]